MQVERVREEDVKSACLVNLNVKTVYLANITIRMDKKGGQVSVHACEDIKRWTEIAEYEPVSRLHWKGREEERSYYAYHWAILLNRYLVDNKIREDRKALFDMLSALYPRNPLPENLEGFLQWMAKKISMCSFFSRAESRLYIDLSLFNHSCHPNCIYLVDKDGKAHLFAFTDISSGEELTLCYFLDSSEPKKDRKARLLSCYEFDCKCSACSNPEDNTTPMQWLSMDHGGCMTCDKTGKLLNCKKCKVARYCSKECQTKDWKPNHRKRCSHLTELFASDNVMIF